MNGFGILGMLGSGICGMEGSCGSSGGPALSMLDTVSRAPPTAPPMAPPIQSGSGSINIVPLYTILD